jgi:NADPH2:quinone reductase
MPETTPQAGEVLVRVHASGVNPSDVKMRLGHRQRHQRIRQHHPRTATAPASSKRSAPGFRAARIGERVWLWNARWKRAFGTARITSPCPRSRPFSYLTIPISRPAPASASPL